jgi:glycosyltransferase involved in cell wall biosynthesis
MKTWLFIGPRLLAGIGQVTKRYTDLVDGEYVEIGQQPKKTRYDHGFAFVLPIENQLAAVDQYAQICTEMTYMTVCETEPVNPVYGILSRYKTIWCPSEFARSTLEKQFPSVEWKLLRHWAPEKPLKFPREFDEQGRQTPYTFYTIGNIADPRKNINGLIQAFQDCQFGPAARLVLKATCIESVRIDVPNVVVINGLLSDEAIERIHGSCHCYVNCSHSEGVGMGAVEAAMMSKPVIITDYGGLKEYIKTPWVVACAKGPIGFDDFLFTKDLEWGRPSHEDLVRCLKECFEQRVTSWDHSWTRSLMDGVKGTLEGSMRSLRCSRAPDPGSGEPC